MNKFNHLFAALLLALPLTAAGKTAELSQTPATENTPTERILSKPTIGGFMNLRAYYDEASDKSTFDVRRARFELKGSSQDFLDYRLQLDFAGNPRILDAWIKLKFCPFFNIQAGQHKLPYSLENPMSPLSLDLIDNAQVISKLVGYSDESGINGGGRDIGVSAYGGFVPRDGGFNTINYTIGLYNGSGINKVDDNKHKDLSGMIDVRPVKALTLAWSFFDGSMNPLAGEEVRRARERMCWSVRYDDGITFRAEYLTGKTGNLKSQGFYAVAGYWVNPKFRPVVRYDFYQSNVDQDAKSTYYSAGAEYWPAKFLRMELNYTLKSLSHPTDPTAQKHMINAQLSVKF